MSFPRQRKRPDARVGPLRRAAKGCPGVGTSFCRFAKADLGKKTFSPQWARRKKQNDKTFSPQVGETKKQNDKTHSPQVGGTKKQNDKNE